MQAYSNPKRESEPVTLKRYAGREGEATFRSMTFEEAKQLNYGQHVWFRALQGDARRFKVNGAPKTWKRDTTRIEIPAKYGMYEYTTFNADDISQGRLLVEIGEDEVEQARR